MSRDEFELWRANPVTRWVFDAIRAAQVADRAEWLRVSWDNAPPDGRTSPTVLIELRTRHDALGELVDNDFETWSIWNGEPCDDDAQD